MVETTKEQLRKYDEVYKNSMALYALLKTGANMQIRRAELKQDQCRAEPVDYTCDIFLKAARELHWPIEKQLWNLVLEDPESYENLPENLRQRLGKAFLENALDAGGHYRALFFRVKNKKEPEHVADEGLSNDQA
jgi:hypothetical protein